MLGRSLMQKSTKRIVSVRDGSVLARFHPLQVLVSSVRDSIILHLVFKSAGRHASDGVGSLRGYQFQHVNVQLRFEFRPFRLGCFERAAKIGMVRSQVVQEAQLLP